VLNKKVSVMELLMNLRKIRQKLRWPMLLIIIIGCLLGLEAKNGYADQLAQIPTVSVPTVTGTPVGAIATVLDSEIGYANVRAGPSAVDYEIVGVLVEGSQVPALGRSPGGDWIMVAYPGVP
jgi:hypothetical protein